MDFAKGYEDGFSGKPQASDNAEYMRGYNLGAKQAARVASGTNSAIKAKLR